MKKYVFLIAFCLLYQSAQADDRAVIARVRSEYPDALSRLESTYPRLTYRGSGSGQYLVYTADSRGKRTTERGRHPRSFDFTRLGPLTACIRSARGVACMNPDYAFVLERKEENRPYVVTNYGERELVERMIRHEIDQYLGASFRFGTILISKVVSHPSFHIRDAHEVPSEAGRLIRIDFDYHPGKQEDDFLRSGWFVVSPDESWAVHQYEIRIAGSPKNMLVGDIEYGQPLAGFPIPQRVSFRYGPKPVGRDGQLLYSLHDFEVEEIGPGPDTERDFRLTAFGLPEIGKPGGKGWARSPTVWFFGLAIVALAVALILKFAAGRLERR